MGKFPYPGSDAGEKENFHSTKISSQRITAPVAYGVLRPRSAALRVRRSRLRRDLFRMICQPRFDYARTAHRVARREDHILFVSEGAPSLTLRLRSTVPLRLEGGDAVAEFTLRAGQSAAFVLEQGADANRNRLRSRLIMSPARTKKRKTSGVSGSASPNIAAGGAKRSIDRHSR